VAKDGRDKAGRFAKGNPGGPGRPPRLIERQYLATISDAVPLNEWQAIVKRAVEDAKTGDAKAREWLSKYLVGEGLTLVELAMRERLGISADLEVSARAEELSESESIRSQLDPFLHKSFLTRALETLAQDK